MTLHGGGTMRCLSHRFRAVCAIDSESSAKNETREIAFAGLVDSGRYVFLALF